MHQNLVNSTLRTCTETDFDAIWLTINDGAQAYIGSIPQDRLSDPYMSKDELRHEIASGVSFWGVDDHDELIAVMGLQHVLDVTLIRHAYVKTSHQRMGIGTMMLEHLRSLSAMPVLIGTWADAAWAIEFYQRHGFRLVQSADKDALLAKYWKVPHRQKETSIVLADSSWFHSRD